MILNKKMIVRLISLIIVAVSCFSIKIAENAVKKEPNLYLKCGNFVLYYEPFDFIPSSDICYVPGNNEKNFGTVLGSVTKFIDTYVYSNNDGTEYIGYYSARKTSSKSDTIVLQFEAYTEFGEHDLDITFSGNSRTVKIDTEKRMFFLKFKNIPKLKDIKFTVSDANEEITIKRFYVVDYPTKYKYEDIFEGMIICPD